MRDVVIFEYVNQLCVYNNLKLLFLAWILSSVFIAYFSESKRYMQAGLGLH